MLSTKTYQHKNLQTEYICFVNIFPCFVSILSCFVNIFLFQRWIFLKYDAVYVVTVMWGRTSLIFIASISHQMSWDIFRQISRFWSWQWVVGVFAKVNLTLLWLIPVVLWIYGPPRHSQDTNRLKYSTLYTSPRLAFEYEFSDLWKFFPFFCDRLLDYFFHFEMFEYTTSSFWSNVNIYKMGIAGSKSLWNIIVPSEYFVLNLSEIKEKMHKNIVRTAIFLPFLLSITIMFIADSDLWKQ